MRLVLFYHSLRSCWNHGNAHFLRGVARELLSRGHQVDVWEPIDGWSRMNLLAHHGRAALDAFHAAYPELTSRSYARDLGTDQLERIVEDADVVLVHEWNDPALVARIGRLRRRGGRFQLFFHDTHHRSISAPHELARYDLSGYDGVLAFGELIRRRYLDLGWAQRAWTWHEAADVTLFRPLPGEEREGDVIWIGNWGDGERTAELHDYLLEPARALRLRGAVHGVRYPDAAVAATRASGLAYRGWLPNVQVPRAFARHLVTVHVPRRPYVERLPGIPTIRVFEALACGIPLVCAPWDDAEDLFEPGDYLTAADGQAMRQALRALINDPDLRRALAERGRRTILARHTCAHRVDELLAVVAEVAAGGRLPVREAS